MSGHKYLKDPNNLFGDVEDVDDETFLRNSRPKSSGSTSYRGIDFQQNQSYRDVNDLEQQRQSLLERKREVEDRTFASSQRSIGLLRESEQIGIATAEELIRQREQLENSSKRLDEINTTLRFSQKHINGIKSVFGSLKNYLSGQKDSPNKFTPSSSNTQFSDSLSESGKQNLDDMYHSHPSTRLRGMDNPETYGNFQELDASVHQAGGSRNMNAILEANLEEMCGNITRLKGLASNLGEEIESQNDLLEDIMDKSDKAEMTIGKQNRTLIQILKK